MSEITESQCKKILNDSQDSWYVIGSRGVKWTTFERATKETLTKYKKIPETILFTDGDTIYARKPVSQPVTYIHPVTDEYISSDFIQTGIWVWMPLPHYETKERLYNGQPTLYWVSNNGVMIPKGVITAVCFLGPKPPGHRLEYIDDDYTNTNPTNLRWILKTKPNGAVRYVSYDKSKKKWRVTCPTLSRKCFASQDDAVAWLKSQQVTITYLDNSDAGSDPGIVHPVSDDEIEEVLHL